MTPSYAAPEVIEGKFPRWSDQYSLAATYCELRTGRPPFEGENVLQIIYAHVHRAPELEDIPGEERKAVARALAKRPEERWPTCREFVRALIVGAREDDRRTRAPAAAPAAVASTRLLETQVPAQPPKVITNTIGMKLVLIPAGEILMGAPDSDKDADDDEKPQHRVRITQPFYLGVTPVTQGQYRAVTGSNPSHFKGSDELPVESVSWEDAQAFCDKLNALEKRDLGGASYRLPTEAEWEYACRAGTTTRFTFGDADAGLGEYAWFSGNSGGTTHPVGQKRPNAWGLYDMHGNVWEWCWDGYEKNYYANSPDADPVGPSEAAARVIRGGSWLNGPRLGRAARRNWIAPGHRSSNVGFRVARVRSGW
jgi:formylglycine-generating enzyme required for sulfatase activity